MILNKLKKADKGEHTELKGVHTRYRLGDDETLFRKVGNRFLKVPKLKERYKVLKEVHDGHGLFGQEATWRRLYES